VTTQRRPQGQGSIYEDRAAGRWVACVDLPRQRHAPRRRRRFIAKSREAVEAKLATFLEEHPPTERLGRPTYVAQARTLGTHTESEWWALVRSVKKVCHYCGITTDAVWTDPSDPIHTQKDHRIPVSRGGSDAIDNIVVSCRGCNGEKGDMTADEYLAWKATR